MDTDFHSPSSTGAPHDEWKTTPNYAYASDNNYASTKDRWSIQDYGGFDFDIPAGAVIVGIEVRVEWNNGSKDAYVLGVELSSDAGGSYTLTGKSAPLENHPLDFDSGFGGASDLWGRSRWSAEDFSDANFRLRLEAKEAAKSPMDVDWVRVKVYYTVTTPTVNNGTGASDITTTSATPHGQVVDGIPTPEVYIYWGPDKGGEEKTAWAHEIPMGQLSGSFSTNLTDLLANQTNYYRCYVTNAADESWAGDSEEFVTDPPSVVFADTSYSIDEGDGALLSIDVWLSITSALPVSVDYETEDGTAEAGEDKDYIETAGTLTWEAEQVGKRTIAIPINDDIDESDEHFSVRLSKETNCTIAGTNKATVVILDDDGGATIRFAVLSSSDLESVSQPTLEVTMSPQAEEAVRVDYGVIGGTATAEDYTLANGTLVFDEGDASAQIPLTVADDKEDEPDQTIVVALSNAFGAVLGLYTNHTYTILDDDAGQPGMDNAVGATQIRSTSATLRGAVTNTGGENPKVYICWGEEPGGEDTNDWPECIYVGTLGLEEFSRDVTPTPGGTYYYRCYITNTGGDSWAPFAENFVAEDPPEATLVSNGGFEDQGATESEAENWTASDPEDAQRDGAIARTDSSSMRFGKVAGLEIHGSVSNALRVSWAGLLADEDVTHPGGGVRPGFVLKGSVYTRAETAQAGKKSEAQFRFHWTNINDESDWMYKETNHCEETWQELVISNETAILADMVGNRCRPELTRQTASGTYPLLFYADDLTISAYLPKLNLYPEPGEVQFASARVGMSSEVTLTAKNEGGGDNTVLYGAYITDVADLVNPNWAKTAWVEATDPSNAFSIVSGDTLAAGRLSGWHSVTLRFTPPAAGTFTGTVRIATTDPIDHFSGGGRIGAASTIVYEEYTLVGKGIAPMTVFSFRQFGEAQFIR